MLAGVDPLAPQTGPAPSARARAVVAFACLALGMIAARAGAPMGVPAPAWFGAACAAAAAAMLLRGRACAGALVVCAVAFGGGWFTARIVATPTGSLRALVPADDGSGVMIGVELEGVVLDDPRKARASPGALAEFAFTGEPAWMFRMRADTAYADDGAVRASGVVRVGVVGGVDESVRAGTRVRVTGRLSPVARPLNPGEPDTRLWAAQRDEAGRLRVPHASLVRVEPTLPGALPAVEAWWLRTRAAMHGRALGVLKGDEAGEATPGRALMLALLLGEDDGGLRPLRDAFARQGLSHLLAISGFHLAIMAGVALFAVRLTGERGRLEPLIVGALVALYMTVVPANAPVLRAGWMVLLLLIAEAAGRRYDRVTVLAWIACAMIVVRPMDLWSLGFQLSFGLTAVLMWLGPTAHARLFGTIRTGPREPPDAPGARWWAEKAKGLVSVSLLCWAVALPTIAHTIGVVSPLAVVCTVVLVPVVLVLLFAGYVVLTLGAVVPSAGAWASGAVRRIGDAAAWLVERFDAVPGTALYAPRLSLALTAAATALVLYWFARGHLRDRFAWAAAGALALWAGGEAFVRTSLPGGTLVRIDAIAVGDGSCLLVRSGRDALLWDCGSTDPGMGVIDIPRALRRLGAHRVRTVVITHPDYDHYSALPDAARPLAVRELIVGERTDERARAQRVGPLRATFDSLAARGVGLRAVGAGDTITLGHATIRFIAPPDGAGYLADNDHSLIAFIEARADDGSIVRALLTGDAGPAALAALLAPDADLRADVLELPHHGSHNPQARALVAASNPAVVLQSTGPSRVDDPRWAAERAGRAWLVTAAHGASWAELRRDGTVRSGAMHDRR
ncbi:MAG: ComEC/Rec2 family competence protein [Phycisphaerales bacterium]|nr:ComEC/Rec2 family competence protein [Phycisphaerales bacterium]